MAEKSGLGQFAGQFPKSYFRKDSLIYDGSIASGQVFYIESGLVRQYCVSMSGTILMTHLFRPGAVFPPTALAKTELNSCYFEAFTPAVTRVIPLDAFIKYLRSHQDFLMDYVSRLSRYFGLLSHRLNLLSGYSAYQRTAAALIYLGERIGKSLDNNDRLIIDEVLTHKDLGAWIGTTRETTSIQMKTLQKKGLISYKERKIIIEKWNDLLQESGQ